MLRKITCEFIYDHLKAIEGMPAKIQASTVITDLPNEYLKSLISLTHAETFRFVEKGKVYSDFEWIDLTRTNSIIIGYSIQMDGKKYFRKILIADGQKVLLVEEDGQQMIKLGE